MAARTEADRVRQAIEALPEHERTVIALRRPFAVAEPFHARPGELTPASDLLDRVEQILSRSPS